MEMSVRPQFMEGDYIETSEGLLFTVKGLLHPKGRVIAYLRYVPDAEGDRRRMGKRYRRVYDIEETMDHLRRFHPQYVGRVDSLGLTLQTVPWNRIAKVYRPRERLRALMAHPRTELEGIAARFASDLASESGVPLDEIGISGSILVGLTSPSSDIDLIGYGEEAGRRMYEALRRLRENLEWISPYDERTVGRVLEARWGDTDLEIERLRGIEIRKTLHGLVCGRDYFVRLVREAEETEATSSTPLCKVRLRAVVAGADDAIFTPCTYHVKDCVLQDAPGHHEVSELVSFRGKFTEQAREGDVIEARGTLEKVVYRGRTAYRMMMGGRGDYLVPQ